MLKFVFLHPNIGFMLAGWLSEIYYRPAVIVPYYLTGYEHAVVAACLVIAMHENVILAVKGYHSAMSYTDVTVIALGYYSAASVCYGFAVLIQIWTCYVPATSYSHLSCLWPLLCMSRCWQMWSRSNRDTKARCDI